MAAQTLTRPRIPGLPRDRAEDGTGGGTIGGYDERCAADLANVAEGRALSRDDRAWLARVVTGAVRPNRDKPLWDLAHALASLAILAQSTDGRDLVTLALDPDLARPGAIEARFHDRAAPGAAADARGVVLGGEPGGPGLWRGTWSGLARLLALAEFLLTAEDLAQFAALSGWLDELARAPDGEGATLLAKRLARHLAAYRGAHMPLAAHERRFRAILAHLGGRTAFADDDVLAVWRAEMEAREEAGERPGFRTVAEHFVTFEAAAAVMRGLGNLNAAAALDAIEGWEDRLDASLADLAAGEPPERLAGLLAGFPDGRAQGPKILTGAERDDLGDFLRLDPFHRTRPLTALRAASFGRVQSGIANRLRRGGGGAGVAERATCAEAESYAALAARAGALALHLARMLRIAAALRLGGQAADLPPAAQEAVAAAEADLRRVRRAGFDDRTGLEAGFAAAEEALLRLSTEADHLQRALGALDRQRPLDAAFAADRAVFAAVLTGAYAGAGAALEVQP